MRPERGNGPGRAVFARAAVAPEWRSLNSIATCKRAVLHDGGTPRAAMSGRPGPLEAARHREGRPQPVNQARVPLNRFRLQVDRQTKATFTELGDAEKAGRDIKKAHPI